MNTLMRFLRSLLFQVLGPERYLQVLSRVYLALVRHRLVEKQYPELFFLEQLVEPGAYCIDIGANLGYYTLPLARLSGPAGQVWSVEPVPLFMRVLKRNVEAAGVQNVTMLPYALGAEQASVRMGTPQVEGVFRHGCTQVLGQAEAPAVRTYEVEMRRPDDLFGDLDRLDFVKCDVEGYETALFPHFTETLRRHRPVVQVEISTAEKRREMLALMSRLGYRVHALKDGQLIPLSPEQTLNREGSDFYFIHEF